MRFESTVMSPAEQELREDVRDFLARELPAERIPALGLAAKHDAEFSRKLAKAGWLGMAVPPKYGGQGRSAVDRFIVTEELLAVGAPIGAHFVADRQTAPTILAYGTEEQRAFFLPQICAGECWFSLGMSEPDSGSDLASVRTTATKVDGGWLVNGTKVWTTGAHLNHYFFVLCRTSAPETGNRHSGLSQLIVDLSAPGVTVSPIPYLNGDHGFNEVVLVDVFVPDGMVLGAPGSGWQQVNSELAFERAGPDRFLSTFNLLRYFMVEADRLDVQTARVIGNLTAQFWTIRQLSLSVARAIDDGGGPAVESAMVKDIGTRFEQHVVEMMRTVAEVELDPGRGSVFEQLLAEAVLTSPSFTLRGGTTEVLRSIASKGLIRG